MGPLLLLSPPAVAREPEGLVGSRRRRQARVRTREGTVTRGPFPSACVRRPSPPSAVFSQESVSYGLLLSTWRNRGPQESEACPGPYYELRQTEVAEPAGNKRRLPPSPKPTSQTRPSGKSPLAKACGAACELPLRRGTFKGVACAQLCSYDGNRPRVLIGQEGIATFLSLEGPGKGTLHPLVHPLRCSIIHSFNSPLWHPLSDCALTD